MSLQAARPRKHCPYGFICATLPTHLSEDSTQGVKSTFLNCYSTVLVQGTCQEESLWAAALSRLLTEPQLFMLRMMDLKLLFFCLVFLCTSQLFATGKSALKPHQKKDVILRTDKEELLFNDRVLMEAKKPKVGHFSSGMIHGLLRFFVLNLTTSYLQLTTTLLYKLT